MAAITKQQIQITWGLHPARVIPFAELYQGINAHVERRNIIRAINNELEIFNYTNYAQYNGVWDVLP
ncbi:MAG: hypothetical protein AAF349_21640 [Cyanobacteria bacterium P01_A01_bin.68]